MIREPLFPTRRIPVNFCAPNILAIKSHSASKTPLLWLCWPICLLPISQAPAQGPITTSLISALPSLKTHFHFVSTILLPARRVFSDGTRLTIQRKRVPTFTAQRIQTTLSAAQPLALTSFASNKLQI